VTDEEIHAAAVELVRRTGRPPCTDPAAAAHISAILSNARRRKRLADGRG
jgi:hypothetical protein